VRQSKENNERIRYLSDAEEIKLRAVMQRAHADRIPEFEVALMTGMRMSEQLTLEWNQIDLDAGTVHLDQTKNGSSRFVRLNSRALAIMHMLHASSIGSGLRPATSCWLWVVTHLELLVTDLIQPAGLVRDQDSAPELSGACFSGMGFLIPHPPRIPLSERLSR